MDKKGKKSKIYKALLLYLFNDKKLFLFGDHFCLFNILVLRLRVEEKSCLNTISSSSGLKLLGFGSQQYFCNF